jgi:hypothetical protein
MNSKGMWIQLTIQGIHGELERIFDKYPKYHMEIILEDCNEDVGRNIYIKTNNWEREYTLNY